MMVQHTLKIRVDNSYQLHWNYFTVSRDLHKHTVNVTRLDKINCTYCSTRRLTNSMNTVQSNSLTFTQSSHSLVTFLHFCFKVCSADCEICKNIMKSYTSQVCAGTSQIQVTSLNLFFVFEQLMM